MRHFVCLTGVDGSGKSTHVDALLEQFRSDGRRCKYVWMRRPYFLVLPLLVYCRLMGLSRYERIQGHRYGHWDFHRSKLVSRIFPWVQLVDAAIFTLWQVYVPLLLGFTVVCDRFVYDTLVDTMVGLRDFELHQKMVGQLFMKLVPQRSATVMLDANESVIKARKDDASHDPYLATRRGAYLALASHLRIPVVDTSEPVRDVRTEILFLVRT